MSIGWKIGGGLLIAAALGLLVWIYGGAQYRAGKADGQSSERTAWQAAVVKVEREKLAAYQAGVASVQRADDRYITNTREVLVPVTRTIIERAASYGATPEGGSLCLPADRVGLLEQTRATLFPATATGAAPGASGALRPDAVAAQP